MMRGVAICYRLMMDRHSTTSVMCCGLLLTLARGISVSFIRRALTLLSVARDTSQPSARTAGNRRRWSLLAGCSIAESQIGRLRIPYQSSPATSESRTRSFSHGSSGTEKPRRHACGCTTYRSSCQLMWSKAGMLASIVCRRQQTAGNSAASRIQELLRPSLINGEFHEGVRTHPLAHRHTLLPD